MFQNPNWGIESIWKVSSIRKQTTKYKTTYRTYCRKTSGFFHSGRSWHKRGIRRRKTLQGTEARNPLAAQNARLEAMSPSWNKKTGLKIPWFNFSAKTFRRLELFCCSTILFAFLLISRKMVPELRACWLFERKKIIYVWVCVSFCPSTKFWLWSSWTVWLKTNLILENPNIWHIFVKENNILPHLVQLENFSFACILAILQVGPRSGYKMYVWQQISNGTAQISSGTTHPPLA